jgi:hypothetical protein
MDHGTLKINYLDSVHNRVFRHAGFEEPAPYLIRGHPVLPLVRLKVLDSGFHRNDDFDCGGNL